MDYLSGVLHRRPGAACAAKKMIPRRHRRRRQGGCRSGDRRRLATVSVDCSCGCAAGASAGIRRQECGRTLHVAPNMDKLWTLRRIWTSYGRCAGSPSLPTPLKGVDKTVGVHSVAHTQARGDSEGMSGANVEKKLSHTQLLRTA